MKRWLWISLACLTLALGVVYYFFDPVRVGWMPRCLWKTATGGQCPGCGSQRMIHALLHGNLSEAWHANAFALCMIPALIFMVWLEATSSRHTHLYAAVHRPVVIAVFGILVVAWWIARNLISC